MAPAIRKLYCPGCGELLVLGEQWSARHSAHPCLKADPRGDSNLLVYSRTLADDTLVDMVIRPGVAYNPPPPPPQATPKAAEPLDPRAKHDQDYHGRDLHCGNLDCEVCPYIVEEDADRIEAHRLWPGGPIAITTYIGRQGQRRAVVCVMTPLEVERDYPDLMPVIRAARQSAMVASSATALGQGAMMSVPHAGASPAVPEHQPPPPLPTCPCPGCGRSVDKLGQTCYPCANGNHAHNGAPYHHVGPAGPAPSGMTVTQVESKDGTA